MDASVVVEGLLRAGEARARLQRHPIDVPHLIDAELVHALRGLALGGAISDAQAERALDAWLRLGVSRHPMATTVARTWELRHNLTAYDAAYVALAEVLGSPLVTCDGAMAATPGLGCAVEVFPVGAER